jgi:hypothetical protein
VKELAFFGGTVMSRWISSRNWRNSNPFSSGRDRLELDLAERKKAKKKKKKKKKGLQKEKRREKKKIEE